MICQLEHLHFFTLAKELFFYFEDLRLGVISVAILPVNTDEKIQKHVHDRETMLGIYGPK